MNIIHNYVIQYNYVCNTYYNVEMKLATEVCGCIEQRLVTFHKHLLIFTYQK